MNEIRIAFAPDMPPAAVEVVSPTMEVVDRFMLDANQSHMASVRSGENFLRVHLPSGQAVTLQEPGRQNWTISLDDVVVGHSSVSATFGNAAPDIIDPPEGVSFDDVRSYHRSRSYITPAATEHGPVLPLGTAATCSVIGPVGQPVSGSSVSRSREAHWDLEAKDPFPLNPPSQLRIEQPSGSNLLVAVPGNARKVWARADVLRDQESVLFTVRIQSESAAADTLAGYLSRGDLYSAEAMTEWSDQAIGLLEWKAADPYAAAIGGYLLLKLKRDAQMRDWSRNLANRFPFLPDGCVIWASQLMQQPRPDTDEIERYLLESINRGIPVYSEGLRLLTDGLLLLGDQGMQARETVRRMTGAVVWDSPVTASVQTAPGYMRGIDRPDVIFDIAFAARA